LYRPPGATLEEALTNGSQALELLPSRDEAVCVIGDLNVDKPIMGRDHPGRKYRSCLLKVPNNSNYIAFSACPYKRTRSRSANRKSAILNAEAHNLKKKFVKAQDRYILSGRQEDKADAAREKKDYDLKLRQLRQQANENVTAES
ncbi:hypothetical protein J6590_092459, partial [Homalodisca vitripennis]